MRWKRCLALRAGLVCVAFGAGSAGVARAAVPSEIAYQGRLTDANGAALAGPVDLDVRIFAAPAPSPGETPLFAETHMGVPLAQGVFSIRIGAGPGVFDDAPRYVELRVNGEVLLPRHPVSAAPYAYHAKQSADLRVFDMNGTDLGRFLAPSSVLVGTPMQLFSEPSFDAFVGGLDVFVTITASGAIEPQSPRFTTPDCTGASYVPRSQRGRIFAAPAGLGSSARSLVFSAQTDPVASVPSPQYFLGRAGDSGPFGCGQENTLSPRVSRSSPCPAVASHSARRCRGQCT